MQLEIRNLKKRYGKKWALNGLTITFTPGVYGILGSNGAGKSTMMNLLTDNLKRDGGEILFDGKDILKLGRDYRKILGYMPQQQGFYEQMTADTFLFYMARLKGLKRKQAAAEIDQLLQVTGLAGERHKKLGGYSGGMRQRVLLAQAMLGNPGILILDEPTAGLDPKERIRIRNFISSLSRDRIILLATHIVSDIESISDRIIMMKKGKLIGTGTSGELMRRVADKVREMPCEPEELPAMQRKYRVGNVFQRDGKTWIRMVGDELPQEGSFVTDHLSLEDVYLYYLGE
ncbi:ATP-binding cassette domain-containing protein [Lachnospiraceae bacterium ASD3451]|uniref:ATP-binding cassette domain-containing protein n=2 Tax=Diplocloster agilis TaxID=2850323 RepID=UPI001D7CB7DB|nr:ATP-binding cassette domain-containing protein [Diplocloster agilis]MBU9743238.1 ATP-binding cassette domain-containing protein [Diplocloster agilis]